MITDLVTKVLLNIFAVIYVFVFVMSLRRGEILFIQGRGLLIMENRKRFLRFVLYHGVIAAIFSVISILSWCLL